MSYILCSMSIHAEVDVGRAESIVAVLCDWQPRIEAIRARMTERGVRLQQLKEQMNGVEDEVFRKFCREIGVANIRSVSTLVSS